MKIVTGYVGEKHITSNDDQGLLQGIFGTGCYILPVRGRLAATLISSNELQIADGEGILQGVHFRVEPGTTDSVTIENGSQGMQRIDLICARYEKNTESGVESMSWINHKGTEAASNPEQPSYTAGDLLAGDTLAEFPVYAVRLNGLTVQSVTQLATILSPQALIGNNSISGIGDGTITGALSALNASLSNLVKVVTGVPLGTLSVNSSAVAGETVDVSSYIPSGYTLAAVIPRTTSSYAFYFYNCRVVSPSSVYVQLRRTTSDATTVSPVVDIICLKN